MSVAWSRCCHSHRRVPWPSAFCPPDRTPAPSASPVAWGLLPGDQCWGGGPPEMSLALNPGEVVRSCSAGLWAPGDHAHGLELHGGPGEALPSRGEKEVTPELLSGRRAETATLDTHTPPPCTSTHRHTRFPRHLKPETQERADSQTSLCARQPAPTTLSELAFLPGLTSRLLTVG